MNERERGPENSEEEKFSADRKLFVLGVAAAEEEPDEKRRKERLQILRNLASDKGFEFPSDEEIADAKKSLGKKHDY